MSIDRLYLNELRDYCNEQYQKHFEIYQMQQRRRTERENKAEMWATLEYCVGVTIQGESYREMLRRQENDKRQEFISDLFALIDKYNGAITKMDLRTWLSQEGRRYFD